MKHIIGEECMSRLIINEIISEINVLPYILGYKSHPRIRRTPTLS